MGMAGAMLAVRDLRVAYGDFQVLWGVGLEVREGEIVSLLGPNGAGKSSIMNAISGLVPAQAGRIEFCGERIDGLPTHRIVARGLSHVLERRRLFPYLTVRQNLTLGAYNPQAKRHREERLGWAFELFPVLRERQAQLAHSLSGGEQQMCAIGRGLMSSPRFLMIDEPFLGLAPVVVKEILRIIQKIRDAGVTVLFIEQNVQLALSVSDRAYVLESGQMVVDGPADHLMQHEQVKKIFLGL
jgi:branched-chain amino acid transport system ATP-binding protein